MMLVNRIEVKTEGIEIRVYRQRLHELLQARSIESMASPVPAKDPGDVLKLKVKARLQRVGREMKLVVHNAEDRAAAEPGLLRIIARAHDFQERLLQDPNLTVPAIASQERLTIGYLSRLLRLPSLAPDIVAAIINGRHPPELSAKRLMRLALKLPIDWTEQRKLLSFRQLRANQARVLRDASLSPSPRMLTLKCPSRDFRVKARANSTKNRLYRLEPHLRG
jgi:hypothetical protein